MTNILFCKTVLHFLKNWVHKLKLPPGMTSIYSSDLHRPQWPWQSYKDHVFTWMNCSWTISPNRISINVRHTSLFILLPFPWLNIFIVDIKEKKTSVLQHADSVKLDQSITELKQCLQLSLPSLQLSHSSLLHALSLCLSWWFTLEVHQDRVYLAVVFGYSLAEWSLVPKQLLSMM